MKKRFPRKVREEAKLILAVCASNGVGTLGACEALGIKPDSASDKLVHAAFMAAYPAWKLWLGPNRKPRPVYAEAEAVLRTGWTP